MNSQFCFLLPSINDLSGAYRDVDTLSITKPNHFVEETLRLKFESYYKPNIDDWNSMKNSKEYGEKTFVELP